MSKTFKRRKKIWDDEVDPKSRSTKKSILRSKVRRPKTKSYKFLAQYEMKK